MKIKLFLLYLSFFFSPQFKWLLFHPTVTIVINGLLQNIHINKYGLCSLKYSTEMFFGFGDHFGCYIAF